MLNPLISISNSKAASAIANSYFSPIEECKMKHYSGLTLIFAALHALDSFSAAFVMPRDQRFSTILLSTADFWKQRSGETNSDFYKRIQDASSDPAVFEKFVLGNQQNQQQTKSEPILAGDALEITETGEKKSGYQRVEDWDADQKKEVSGWNDKVQFDGRRYGNGFNQNEILRQHLKGF